MFTSPLIIGILSGVLATVALALRTQTSRHDPFLFGALCVGALAYALNRFVIRRRHAGSTHYDGLSDLFIHIHSPASPDSWVRWFSHGLISLCSLMAGVPLGPDGLAIEWGHATLMAARPRSAHWFEQRRRTDAAVSLSAGVSAAFMAPFGAILLPGELGIGGRNASVVIASLAAFLSSRFLAQLFGLDFFTLGGSFYGLRLVGWSQWLAILVIAAGAAGIGTVLTALIRFAKDSVEELRGKAILGGALLTLLAWAYPAGRLPFWTTLESALTGRMVFASQALQFGSALIGITLVLSCFGTAGLFWPAVAIGGFFGGTFQHLLLPGVAGLGPVPGLVGASAVWGALLGAPLSGAVLCYELAGNLQVLVPCLIAAFLGREMRKRFRVRGMLDRDLESRGLALIQGRSASVLDAIAVRDAMVGDHNTIHEQESVSELFGRLQKSPYPFMPVVNSQGIFLGLLTVDMVQDAWRRQQQTLGSANSPLLKLLEAKDLLYRSGFNTPRLREGDTLSKAATVLGDSPCAPVLSTDGKVLGLLFSYSIRLAYDREVARRSLILETQTTT